MRPLEAFINDHNHWYSHFPNNMPIFSYPLSQEDVNEIANEIDSQMSPENLHCDGEISSAAANKKGVRLMKVVNDLRRYCKEQNLSIPEIYEAWD